MPTRALFYSQATPVTRERHRDWCIETESDYSFAKKALCVPLGTVEFTKVATECPIVFLEQDAALQPVALLGLTEGSNLLVKADGGWDGRYIPAFIRRYPFVFASHGDGGTFTLCVDETFPGLNRAGRGERLFGSEGENTAYLERVLAFLEEYEVQHRLTREFCRQIQSLGLLEPMHANVSLDTGDSVALGGFHTVKRELLNGLDGGALSELAKRNALELLYVHLFSLENFSALVRRLSALRA